MKEINANQILKDIPKLLSTSGDIDASMKDIINEIENSLEIESAAIYYLSEDCAYLKYPSHNSNFNNFQVPQEIIKQLYSSDDVIILPNNAELNLKADYIYLVPLKIRETIFGFICAANKKEISAAQLDALKALAGVAAYAIKDTELSNVFKIQLKALQASIVDKTLAVKTIKEQNEKILEADKAKNEFIANISHELRTPLNAIIGFSEVLSSKIFGELNEKQAEYINDIYTSGVHLLGMINEVLDISKLESNAMSINYSEFDLSTAINEVISVMKPLADKKHIKVSFEDGFASSLNGDFQKTQQIMYNLVSNAVKFTPDKGSIKISTSKSGNQVQICVKDSGIGIDRESQAKIFDKFVQLENTYTKTGSSTGLGLTITKRFVEMMKGSISVKSEKGKGAEFIVLLPLKGKNG